MRTGRVVAVVLAAVLVAAGVTYVVTSRLVTSQKASTSASSTAPSTSATQNTGGGSSSPTTVGGDFRVLSVSPRSGSTGVSGSSSISLSLSQPLAQHSPMPTLNPNVPGSWHVVSGRTLVFKPSTPFVPLSNVSVTVPSGQNGLLDAGGQALRSPTVDRFTVADGSTFRLQQLLSILSYSPLSWTPTGAPISPSDTAAQLEAMYSPPSGTFSWRQSGWPARLHALWQKGQYNVFTRGLVMEFQADHGLTVDGKPSGGLWNALLNALAAGQKNSGGYNYAIGDKRPPQYLTIWHDGKVVFKSRANTGIPQSPTPSGNFNVYARYRHEIMRGKNPNGTHYADPVQYVAYFHDGDAVHYFPRADYGVPQSLGCIELPLPAAAKAWPYLAYGTIVTVIN